MDLFNIQYYDFFRYNYGYFFRYNYGFYMGRSDAAHVIY